ncbi:MAG: hypothetical protein E7007_03995 [Alphaproteobacteria bacterium]|nr:hypothetical protein [Alphaproteobacteria bacterium]
MPAIHVNNVEIQVYEQQYTSPTLHVQNTDGKIYHAIVIPDGGEFLDTSEKLVYSNADDNLLDSNGAINECQGVTLDAGMYRVELRGGAGGKQSRCNAGLGKTNITANVVSQIFKLPTQTTVYAFRGGDGNDSPTVTKHQIPGGGASGVDSMLVVGDRAIVGIGAPSSQCFNLTAQAYPGGGGQTYEYHCQSTPSGTYSVQDIKIGDSYIYSVFGYSEFGCGGGGGGAPNGVGGAAGSSTQFKMTAGENATTNGGGNGGDAENLMGDSQTKNIAYGGAGGKNVYWQCAGHTAVSYGGGGGGATCALRHPSSCESTGAWCYSDCADGGDGASGSTGTSDTSYVKIYKIG